MSEAYEQNATQIMQKCSDALVKQQYSQINDFSMNEPSQIIAKKDQFKELFSAALNSCISPLEESQNNKIIQKLRKKNNKKKQLKEVVIRKTDLGQNQLIFTKQELQKLKQIDDEQLYGFPSSPPQNPTFLQNLINGINGMNLGQQANKKYFGTTTPENSQEQIMNYLDWVDLKELKKSKDKKKSKILNFQKRQRSPSNSIDSSNKTTKNPLPSLMQKYSSPAPVRNMKPVQLSKSKSSYPLTKKSTFDKGFLNSININQSQERREGEKQKMSEILFKVNQYIQREYDSCQGAKKYIYMTEDRKQALYECQVLRRVKRQIGPKFYENLQLSFGNKISQQKNDDDDIEYEKENNDKNENILSKSNGSRDPKLKKNQNSNIGILGKERNYTGHKQKLTFETQADRMIHKNRNRLKQERKRVIQRIIC